MTEPARKAAVCACAGAAGLLGLTACGTAKNTDALGLPLSRPVTAQELRGLAQSTLLYPGSRLVRRIGSDERAQSGDDTVHEPDPAFAGSIATTAASAAAVLTWYSTQMAARGYVAATYYRLADQVDGRAWTIPHTRDQVQVAVYRSSSPKAAAPAGSIAYEEILVDYRLTGPPPGGQTER